MIVWDTLKIHIKSKWISSKIYLINEVLFSEWIRNRNFVADKQLFVQLKLCLR